MRIYLLMTAAPQPKTPAMPPSRRWAWIATLISGAVTVVEYLDSQQVISFVSGLGPNGPKYAAFIAAAAGLVTVWTNTKHTDQSAQKAAVQ
jgi:hypothetical protein